MSLRQRGTNKKTKNKKKTTFLELCKKVFFWLVFFGFWGVAIWTVIFSTVMKIETVEVINAAEDEVEIRRIVENKMRGKYLQFVPRDNLLSFPVTQLSEEILQRFILIRAVEIKREFPTRMVLEVERRKKVIVWCVQEKCWLVDERAEAFYQLKQEELKALIGQVVVVNDGSGRVVNQGDQVTDLEIAELCSELVRILETEGGPEIDSGSVYIPSAMSGEIRVKTKAGWEIYFSTERSVARQIKILNKILNTKITKPDLLQLEYIDLRVKGKVVYRFRNYQERERELEEIKVKGKTDQKEQEITEADSQKTKKKKRKKKKDN